MKTDERNSGFVELMRQCFVSKEIFELRLSPLEKLVYGFTSIILLSFASAVVVFFIKK